MLTSLYLSEVRTGLKIPEYWIYFLLSGAVTFLLVQVANRRASRHSHSAGW